MLLGLFYGQDIVYSSFSSLLLRAMSCHTKDTLSIAILRAGRSKLYCGFYKETSFEEKIITPQEFLEWTEIQNEKFNLNISHKEIFSEKEWGTLDQKISEITFDTVKRQTLPILSQSSFLQTEGLQKAKLNYLQDPDIKKNINISIG